MIKRFFCIVITLLIFCSFTVTAQTKVSLTAYGDFYVLNKDRAKIAEILNMSIVELDDYCSDNSITYLAVNENNTKQIVLFEYESDFSNSVINISQLPDDSINALLPDITGLENIKGEIIKKGTQKFILVNFKSEDSGGEYITTQYITVADKKNYILNFYSHISEDTQYTEKTFESFESELFLEKSESENISKIRVVVIIATVIFSIACLLIAVSIIRDIKREKKNKNI